jgi:hypothetical protein
MLRPAEQIPPFQNSGRMPSDKSGRVNKREAFEKIKRLLGSISGEINQDLAKYAETGVTGFVSPDCSINMRAFEGKAGFDKDSIDRDEAQIRERQIDFSNAKSERTREFYAEKKGQKTMTIDEVIEAWKDNREKSLSSKLEMSVTSVFHKVLKSEFLVVRASTYDDYHNGADTVIVNKETGDVICAIDEFNDEGDRSAAKQQKAKKTDNRGASIRYGLTFKKDNVDGAPKLAVGPLSNIPVFYLKLSREELESLLTGMDYSSTDRLNPVELEIFDKLTAYLGEQAGELEGKTTNSNLAANIKRAINSIDRMMALRQEKFGQQLH